MQVLLLPAGDQTVLKTQQLRYPVWVPLPGTCPTTPHRTMVTDLVVLLFGRPPRTKAGPLEAGK